MLSQTFFFSLQWVYGEGAEGVQTNEGGDTLDETEDNVLLIDVNSIRTTPATNSGLTENKIDKSDDEFDNMPTPRGDDDVVSGSNNFLNKQKYELEQNQVKY